MTIDIRRNFVQLTCGRYLALTKQQLGHLRKAKGDPARRTVVQELFQSLSADCKLDVGKTWSFLEYLLQHDQISSLPQLPPRSWPPLCCLTRGRSLHKGSSYAIELLETENVAKSLDVLQNFDLDSLRTLFMRIDEQAFRFRYGSISDYENWKVTRQPSQITDEQFSCVATSYDGLRDFLSTALKSQLQLICYLDFSFN